MKCLFSAFLLIFFVSYSFAQNIYQIKADSVRIYNTCDTAELILENRTQNVSGFLFNKGKGRTEFQRLRLKPVNGNALAIEGQDTLLLSSLIKTAADPLYIWQQAAVSQPVSNFWISGTGRASAFMTNNTINSPHTVWLKPGGNISRWATFLYNTEPGTGNQGSDFRLARYSDSGTFVSNVMTVERATGIVTFNDGMRANGYVGVNTEPGFRLSVADVITRKYDPNNTVKASYPMGTIAGLYNMAQADENYAGMSIQGLNALGLYQSVYMGVVTVGGNAYRSNFVFGQRTGDTAYTERMRIAPNGSVGIGTTTPAALLDVNGAVRIANAKNNATGDSILTTDVNGIVRLKSPGTGIMPISVIAGNITLGPGDYTTIINNSAAVTVTLPVAASNKGRIYNVKKISNNAMNITIQAQSGDLIESGSSFIFNTYNKSVQMQSSGTAWYIIN
jgi:hypothetical protein